MRAELGIAVRRPAPRRPSVPSAAALRRYDETVWQTLRLDDLVRIQTLLYTGV